MEDFLFTDGASDVIFAHLDIEGNLDHTTIANRAFTLITGTEANQSGIFILSKQKDKSLVFALKTSSFLGNTSCAQFVFSKKEKPLDTDFYVFLKLPPKPISPGNIMVELFGYMKTRRIRDYMLKTKDLDCVIPLSRISSMKKFVYKFRDFFVGEKCSLFV